MRMNQHTLFAEVGDNEDTMRMNFAFWKKKNKTNQPTKADASQQFDIDDFVS